MTTHRFDSLTRSLSTRLSRRSALQASGLAAVTGLTAVSGLKAMAQDATPTTDEVLTDDTFLFVQTATGGTFAPNPGAGTPTAADGSPALGGGADHLLTLEGHTGSTVYFSDRPERVFGAAPTDRFLAGLGFAPDNPPNAALVTKDERGDEDILVVELVDPGYDAGSGTITYGVNVLSEYEGEGLAHVAARQQDAALPERFGEASLFIDECPTIESCYHGGDNVGPVPGGPIGTCWSWSDVSCQPCDGNSTDYYGHLCDQTYPVCAEPFGRNASGCNVYVL